MRRDCRPYFHARHRRRRAGGIRRHRSLSVYGRPLPGATRPDRGSMSYDQRCSRWREPDAESTKCSALNVARSPSRHCSTRYRALLQHRAPTVSCDDRGGGHRAGIWLLPASAFGQCRFCFRFIAEFVGALRRTKLGGYAGRAPHTPRRSRGCARKTAVTMARTWGTSISPDDQHGRLEVLDRIAKFRGIEQSI